MTEFSKQYAIRLPNGQLHAHKPSSWSVHNGIIMYATDEDAAAQPVVYDTLEDAEYGIQAFQERAAHMGITEWLGRIETRYCTPFSHTEPTTEMLADLESWLEDKLTGCVFCPDNWDNLDVVTGPITMGDGGRVLIINPRDPVTEGHVLLIHETHGPNIASNYFVAGDLMKAAAFYLRGKDQPEGTFQANVITSMGSLATQTVMHTHVHVVPRRENDGLPLPWTPQHELKKIQQSIVEEWHGKVHTS